MCYITYIYSSYMNNKRLTSKEMVAKSKNKALSCSTPEHRIELDSPSRDSDSICDSECSSPVPFLCTQDGAEGQVDVVWNFYTPKSEAAKSRFKNTTPASRRTRKTKPIEKPLPRRRAVKPSQKKTELFQELIELNQNLHDYITKKPSVTTVVAKPQSEEDIFSDTSDSSPRSGIKSKTRCLRKNVLSSKFTKAEPESGLESDDSMNECLIKASQIVENNILHLEPKPAKRPCQESITKKIKPGLDVNIDQDSMDAILSNIKLGSATANRIKNCDSPRLNNDSFDCLLGNLNDSALERLSQMPVKTELRNNSSKSNENNWMVKELVVCDGSPSSRSVFGRHMSMPESPSISNSNMPSTSGTAFGRYSSMPFNKSDEKITVPGDSPIRCTPDEIKQKHKQAREKLMAKRLFWSKDQSKPALIQSHVQPVPKKTSFQLKVPSNNNIFAQGNNLVQRPNTDVDIKSIIEKKRQEALMKLRKRQPQNK